MLLALFVAVNGLAQTLPLEPATTEAEEAAARLERIAVFSARFFRNVQRLSVVIAGGDHLAGRIIGRLRPHGAVIVFAGGFEAMPKSEGVLLLAGTDEDVLGVARRLQLPVKALLVVLGYACNSPRLFESLFARCNLKDALLVNGLGTDRYETFDPFTRAVTARRFDRKPVRFRGAKNYHRYPIRASLFESVPFSIKRPGGRFIGVDVTMMETLSACLNVTFLHHEPGDKTKFGGQLENGTLVGAIGELMAGKIDIGFNQLFVKMYNLPGLTFTRLISSDELCVVVPKSGLMPSWSAFFRTFPTIVWIWIILTFLYSALGLFAIRYCKSQFSPGQRRRSLDYNPTTVVLDLLQAFYNAAPSQYFSNRHYERLFVASIYFFILIHTTTFQSSLVTVLTKPTKYPDISSLEQLDGSGYRISTSSSTLNDTFAGSRLPHKQSLQRKLEIIGKERQRFPAWLTRQARKKYLDAVAERVEGLIATHLVEECPRSYHLAYMAREDAFFLADFDGVIQRVFEAGLLGKWGDDVQAQVTASLPRGGNSTSRGLAFPRPFSDDDLQSAFYLHVMGLAVGFACFAVEVFLCWIGGC